MCRRRAGLGCLVIFLLLAGGIGWFVYDLQRADPALVAAAKPPTPNDTQAAQTTATQIETQFKNPAPTGPTDPSAFEVTLTEQDVNQLLRAHPDIRPQLDSKGVAGARLSFEPELVRITARVPLGPVKARISVSGTLAAENGMLRYRTTEARIGALKAPDAARTDLDSALSDAFEKLNRDSLVRIEQVEVTEGKLVLRGHKKVGGQDKTARGGEYPAARVIDRFSGSRS